MMKFEDITAETIASASKEELQQMKELLGGMVSSLNNKQQAMKITLNSFYGALASEYFRWFDMRLAEAITVSGRTLIQWVERDLTAFLNKVCGTEGIDYCIAIDTDSLMYNFAEFVKKFVPEGTTPEATTEFLDQACKKKINKVISDSVASFCAYSNIKNNRLNFERDIIADSALYFNVKKRYMLQVRDEEGVRLAEPELKVVGGAVVSSGTPQFVREELKRAFVITLNLDNERLLLYLDNVKKRYMKLPVEEISSPRGITEFYKFLDSTGHPVLGTPHHVKAGITYNKMLEKKGLLNRYRKIGPGDKIKFVPLRVPNPTGADCIGFMETLPKEFDLDKYVDRDNQYERTFLKPLRDSIDALGWNVERIQTLDDFF